MNAPLPGREPEPKPGREPRPAFDPSRIGAGATGVFPIVPWVLVTAESVVYSPSIDVREHLGLMLRVEVQSLAGTSPGLQILTQRSLDGTHWMDDECPVPLSAVGTTDVERHLLGRELRIHQYVSGTNPQVLYKIDGLWLSDWRYSAPESATSVSWDTDPLTAGQSESFTVTGVVPGGKVLWQVQCFDASPQVVKTEVGVGGLDANGTFQGTSALHASTVSATLTVQHLHSTYQTTGTT